MQIHGINKTTLLDYPGIVATTVFTGHCNFRCPFCQNSDLVIDPSSQPLIDEQELFKHLERRKGIVEGVCITGGEPTLSPDLKDFIKEIKAYDVKVKLDTNGYRPEVLKELISEGIIDYVAMDIKSSLSRYDEASGIVTDTTLIEESVEFIKKKIIPYEFRTTVVKELHDVQTFKEIALLLHGAESYFLQGFIDSERVMCSGLTSYSGAELAEFIPIFDGHVKSVKVRGVD